MEEFDEVIFCSTICLGMQDEQIVNKLFLSCDMLGQTGNVTKRASWLNVSVIDITFGLKGFALRIRNNVNFRSNWISEFQSSRRKIAFN